MENDKYYTPEKEDFFIGYEFEIYEDFDYYPEKSWHEFVYENETVCIENMQCPFAYPEWEGKIRTKFLASEDIELLGWEYGNILNDNDQIVHGWELYKNENDWCQMEVVGERKYQITHRWYRNEVGQDMEILYRGVIKSINELNQIMKIYKL